VAAACCAAGRWTVVELLAIAEGFSLSVECHSRHLLDRRDTKYLPFVELGLARLRSSVAG
jgi:hypothetical protein